MRSLIGLHLSLALAAPPVLRVKGSLRLRVAREVSLIGHARGLALLGFEEAGGDPRAGIIRGGPIRFLKNRDPNSLAIFGTF